MTAVALLVVTSLSAAARAETPRELLERIVQCKASDQDVAKFNHMLDQNQVNFPKASDVDVWGGAAWKLDRPIAFGGVSSDVVVMNSRKSAYIRVKSVEPRAGVIKAATELDLYKKLDEGDSLWYRRTFGNASTSALTSDDKVSYWVGCEY